MQNFIESCLTDPYFEQFTKLDKSPASFKKEVCQGCSNLKCMNAGRFDSKFSRRMATQEDRLLTNPRFADPKDPRFRDIAKLDFPDMLHRAVVLEVTSRKNDWSVPTEEEVSAITTELTAPPQVTPSHFVATEPQDTEEAPSTWQVRGDSGTDYTVTLNPDQTWQCTCPSRQSPCKHVRDVALKLSRGSQEPPLPRTQAPQLPPARPPERGPAFSPRALNTEVPDSGIMIGGAPLPTPSQKVDPWAPPSNAGKSKAIVIPVGGRVRFGSK